MRNRNAKTAGIEGAAAALYIGEVMHARLKPVGHRFNYRGMSLLIDLDRLDVADRQTPLFGVNRRALYSFHELITASATAHPCGSTCNVARANMELI